MKAINLFVLTRDIDSDVLSEYEYALSSRNKPIKFRLDEIDLIKTIVDIFLFRKADLSVYGGWFYSFTIPQIGKEFDLLRIGENTIINLELKNQFVDLKKIEKQLKQNRYYLSHLKKTVHSFTVIRDDNKKLRVYKFEDSLKNSSFKELIEKIQEDSFYLDSDIEDLFDPCYYLVSPISTPDRFLKHEYFLNNQQLDIKRSIMNSDPDNRLFGIKGSAGTGKTLLLYDIAFTYGKTKKTCIIHSGLLPEDYNCLNIRMDYISLIEEKSIKADILKQFDVICVDETQRLNSALIDSILEIVRNHNNKICIFSYDFAQTLSKSEIQRNTPKKLNEIHGFVEYKLPVGFGQMMR